MSLIDIDHQDIMQTVRDATSVADAARTLNVSRQRLAQYIALHEGGARRSRGRPRKHPPQIVIDAYLANERSLPAAALALDVSRETVRKTLVEHAPHLYTPAARKAA